MKLENSYQSLSSYDRDTQIALAEINGMIEKLMKKLPLVIVVRALAVWTRLIFEKYQKPGDWDQLELIWEDLVDLNYLLELEILPRLSSELDFDQIEDLYEQRYG